MPDFDTWRQSSGRVDTWLDLSRTANVALMLELHGVSITLYRSGSSLGAQTVLIVGGGSPDERPSDVGFSGETDLYVVGATTLNIRPGDVFTYQSVRYEVEQVLTHLEDRVKASIRGQR